MKGRRTGGVDGDLVLNRQILRDASAILASALHDMDTAKVSTAKTLKEDLQTRLLQAIKLLEGLE